MHSTLLLVCLGGIVIGVYLTLRALSLKRFLHYPGIIFKKTEISRAMYSKLVVKYYRFRKPYLLLNCFLIFLPFGCSLFRLFFTRNILSKEIKKRELSLSRRGSEIFYWRRISNMENLSAFCFPTLRTFSCEGSSVEKVSL